MPRPTTGGTNRPPPRALLTVLAALLLPACDTIFERSPAESLKGRIEITISPNPVPMVVTCPSPAPGGAPATVCFGSIDPTVTISEKGGVGGHLNFVEIVVRNATTGRDETKVTLDASAISRQVGTNRIEAFGRLAFRPVVTGYPVPAGVPRPQLLIVLTVQFADDKGNVLTETARVNVV